MIEIDSVFMIRNGGFGSNFEYKLYMSLAGFVVCLLDKKFKKRNDYFWVFLTGTIIWTTVEIVLKQTGTRDIKQAFLFDTQIPFFVGALLQGMSEGAVIALIGIGFGDYVLDDETRKWGIVAFISFLAYTCIRVLVYRVADKNIAGVVASRRDMFTPASLLFLACMILIGIAWFFKTNERSRKRGLMMVLILIVFVFKFCKRPRLVFPTFHYYVVVSPNKSVVCSIIFLVKVKKCWVSYR